MSANGELIVQLTEEICSKLSIPNKPYNKENEVLSQFMLNLHENSVDVKDFKEKLISMGVPKLIEDKFVDKVDALIREKTALTIKTEIKQEDFDFSISPDDLKDDKLTKGEKRDSMVPTETDSTEERPAKRKQSDRGDYEEPQLNKIYRGRVVNITNFGAFIRLYGLRSRSGRIPDGLCHISAISTDRISHPSDLLKLNEEVFVKLVDMDRTDRGLKLSLSMKNVNQHTGEERDSSNDSYDNHTSRGRTQTPSRPMDMPKRRMTSPERWQISQLIASGVLSAKDYPELAEDVNAAFMQEKETADEGNQEVEIELKREEPPFLKGQEYRSIESTPIQIVKKPEGSLNRAALAGSTLVRERKEKKIEEQKKSKEEKQKELATRRKLEYDPISDSKLIRKQRDEEEQAPVKLSLIEAEWKRQVKEQSMGKRTNMSIKEQRETLPVFKMRSTLVNAVKENQFLVVVGETGSGKTTQITQYLAEEGFNTGNKIIACTQPRRVAAVSVAKRVADEVGCRVGDEVGYTIRFEDVTSNRTKIKYMTDGMLQKEVSGDPEVSNYSVIMLDEAHERTIATDVLFSLLKKACLKNPDLRLIVTSATLDAEKFSKFFNDCPIIKIPGKTFPVEVYYTSEPEFDYMNACLDAVMEIHTTQPSGDILVFLTGQEEIDTCCELLFERTKILGDAIPELIILPVYSALPSEMQSRIFEPTPPNKRKVIVATNIAETSITIDGIYYVIDPGFVKLNAFDPKLGMDSLIISPISQAQANQRKGRAGRTGPGKCYRLYTQSAYNNEMMPQTIPEIQRQNLSNTILMLKAMGIDDLINFEFLDPPPVNNILTSLEELYALEALEDDGNLTELGRQMANFPMEPSLSKTLLISLKFGCTEEILTIVAMLSVQSFFYRPKEKLNQADQRKLRFHHPHGDHLTLLNLFQQWSNNAHDSKKWCLDNFIHERSMKRAKEVRFQLMNIMKRYRHTMTSCGNDTDKIRKLLCAGFFKNSAKRDSANSCYQTLIEKTSIYMHPSSSLFHKQNSDYVIYHTLLLTTKEYMHCVTLIDPNWLVEFAPNFFTKNDPHKLSAARRSEKIQPLYNKFDQTQSWRLTKLKSAKKKALSK